MTQGVTIIEKDGKLMAQKTTLGADNGIAIATMMALADTEDRPTLELVFTIGEEVGLVGAHDITLPI
jgi:dipeptidase D